MLTSKLKTKVLPTLKTAEPKGFMETLFNKPTPADTTCDTELEEYLVMKNSASYDVSYFWINHKEKFPNLYVVAQNIFGVLPGEAISEHAFSVLKTILPHTRTSLDPQTLECLLLGKFLSDCSTV